MIIKIDVCKSDLTSADEIADKLADAQGWEVMSSGNTVTMKTPEGRVGQYDVANDILIWDDDPNETEYAFFGTDDDFYVADSLAQYLGVSTAIWGEDEDGNYLLYTEL